jgi:alcohol dehydrogenase class IV
VTLATSQFAAPTRIVAGRGCVAASLGEELRALGAATVAVVADRGFAACGALDGVLAAVSGVAVPVCGLVGEDPGVGDCEAALARAVETGASAVLAIGGGSALCAGKAVAIRMRNAGALSGYEGVGRLDALPAPTVAVPTTAGSGSEVSNVTVLHEPGRERHLVIGGHGYAPAVALLDGELLATLPRRPMIAAALDALSHALESLWVRGSSRFTGAMALAAAGDIRAALPRALGGDRAAMQQLIEASAMANLACGNSGLGLVHALTSAPAVTLPHGYQNAVLLPHVAAFNREHVAPLVAAEIDGLAALYDEVGFEARFAAGEVGADGARAMVAAAMSNPMRQNNRREASEEELSGMLGAAGAGR